jgi:hypothetical protein
LSVDELRAEIRGLAGKRARGDLGERAFRRRGLLAEHHVVHSHFRWTESVLDEPEQATVSYFATGRRLLRVRGTLVAGRGQAGDTSKAVVDDIAYAQVKAIESRRQWRWGEVATGAAIVLLALLLRGTLAVTGPVLVLLGAAGALHGLLMPTRWTELVLAGPDRFEIHGTWRRSGRRLLAAIRNGLSAERGQA